MDQVGPPSQALQLPEAVLGQRLRRKGVEMEMNGGMELGEGTEKAKPEEGGWELSGKGCVPNNHLGAFH